MSNKKFLSLFRHLMLNLLQIFNPSLIVAYEMV